MLSKTISSICWRNNIKEFPYQIKKWIPSNLEKQGNYILSIYLYIEGDLRIVILISKFPTLCHDMKAYPRIWCMNVYPIIQLSYLQCPGDIIISGFGKTWAEYHVVKLVQSNYISISQ